MLVSDDFLKGYEQGLKTAFETLVELMKHEKIESIDLGRLETFVDRGISEQVGG